MRPWAERLRLIAAVLLIASLSLPVSKCTYYADADGKWVSGEIAQQNPAAVHEVTEYQFALERSKPASDRWLTLACFVLPLAMVLAQQFVRHRAALLMLRYLEPLALAYSALGLIDLTLFGVASGGYLAAASLTIYLIAMLAIDAILVRTWWRERRRTEPIQSSRS
jgi:hypothetical protein